jgi:hypothetical protein
MTLQALKLTLTIIVPLPKRDIGAVAQLVGDALDLAHAAESRFAVLDPNVETTVDREVVDEDHEETPSPSAPPTRKRRARSAPADNSQASYEPGPSATGEAPPPGHSPAEPAARVLAGDPHSGAVDSVDPLDIPAFLRVNANGERAA